MKILTAAQIREADAYTIAHEPIASIDLMERASQTFTEWFVHHFPDTDIPVSILCGPGNNGGDGLAVARLLHQQFYQVEIYICKIGNSVSEDFSVNLKRLPGFDALPVYDLEAESPLPDFPAQSIVIDAIFGSGLNRPVEGYWATLLAHINDQQAITTVAIDIPSGLFADKTTRSVCIEANHTFTFEMPKLAFLFPENNNYTGRWWMKSIGLHPDFLTKVQSSSHYLDGPMVAGLWKQRQKYDHKGTFGHALLMVGSHGKMGAAVLATNACLRSGVGLVTAYIARSGYEILQISCPEAMVVLDTHESFVTDFPELSPYRAIGVGSGIGQNAATAEAIEKLLKSASIPLVLDADALNILSQKISLLDLLPKHSILTPHPKEFERLFGKTRNNFERNELQRRMSKEKQIYILLKGAHSCITTPEGEAYFNSTGNPGMATAGSGDVLTGIITGLFSQGYPSFEALTLGVFLHGLAGDLAAETHGQHSMIAGDIIAHLGKAIQRLQKGWKIN